MIELAIYNQKGEKVDKIKIAKEISQTEINPTLIHQAVITYLANHRQATADTKTRGEVSGGGRKPWRQKGTGRARAGSIRSPLWRGGGINFGPANDRNYSLRFNKKMRQKALLMALNSKIKDKKFFIVKDFAIKEPKTKQFTALLDKLSLQNVSILLILSKSDLIVGLSAANLPYVNTIMLENLNTYDILKYDVLLTNSATLKILMDKYSSSNTKEK